MTEKTTHSDKGGGGNYWRFMAMVSTSTVIMFFLMYTNSFDADDLFWSETRFWMMFVMGAMMMVVMLLFMWGMYKDRTKNLIILGVGAFVFALALWLVRSQVTDLVRSIGLHAGTKAILSERLGVDCGAPRPPGQPITPEQRTMMQKRLNELGIGRASVAQSGD